MPISLHQQAVDHLGSRIIDGSVLPGEVVLASELEDELGVSRSVIREAVRVLASAGLVVSTKRVGIKVQPAEHWNPFDPLVIRWRLASEGQGAQLRSLTELRVAVEPMAAELAAEHAPAEFCAELLNLAAQMRHAGREGDLESFLELDIRFHALVLAASGNEMFANLAHPIGETLRGRTELGLMPEHPHEEALAWHQGVADAISAHDPKRARESMELIMRRTVLEIYEVWAHKPRLFPRPVR
ncbi:FadR/GntR family transcriptional regulator [Paeniglutamicibacter sp. Y32M11]|uniref:FadR/GntR family transcriptional regulator n=1 Tax=Paeniglutamicibacter sp. Y32M11 TaxID=2853258 RepID=UPI001C52D1F0|nr:FCD domain-containing protein [Paeniglutamicibacter sp. Y32M11]QXQ08852.1 FCD domain-containing protein [Paeniglutamicibacter sp. Y32M11]